MAIKCNYSSCNVELTEENIKNFLLDSIGENYSGFYCSDEHFGFDVIKNIFPNSSSFVEKAIAQLNLTVNGQTPIVEAAVPTELATGNQLTQQTPQATPAIDSDLDLINQANDGVGNGVVTPAVIATVPVVDESNVLQQCMKLNSDMANLVQSLVQVASNSKYPLGLNPMEDSYNYKGITVPRTMYSFYVVDPSFTFNLVYSPEFVSLIFANDSYNFTIKEMDKLFQDVAVTATSLQKKIEAIINQETGNTQLQAGA